MTSPDPFSLRGQVALVTGGAGVLGRAICRALLDGGATVLVASRDAQRAADCAHELAPGGSCHGLKLDCGDAASTEHALSGAERDHGPIGILVNGAGGNLPGATVGPDASLADVSSEDLEEVVRTNLFAGALVPTAALLRSVKKSPRETSVINVGSVSAMLPLTRVAGYSAAKAAVENFTRWAAVHAARDLGLPVRVNALVPGFFLTEQNRFLLVRDDGTLTERGGKIIDHTPLGRFGEPEDIHGAIRWLASPASRFVTGTTVVVDGGFTAWWGV